MDNKKEKRNENIDVLKGILAILVVYGHVIQICGSGNAYENEMFRYIYSFHMPLFMMLAGYTLFFSINKPIQNLIIKRSIFLGIPIIFWGFESYSIYLIKNRTHFSIWELVFKITAEGLWFLYCIMFNNFVIVMIYKFLKNKLLQIISVIVVFVLCIILCEYIKPMRMITYMYPYYVVGFWLQYYKIKLDEKIKLGGYYYIRLYCSFLKKRVLYIQQELVHPFQDLMYTCKFR